MLIENISTPYERACITNAIDTGFPSIVPTATEPTRSATKHVIDISGAYVQGRILFQPFGTDTNDQTFDLRLYGWRLGKRQGSTYTSVVWVPTLIAQVACTLDSGLAAVTGSVLNGMMCDTISLTTGGTSAVEVVSPAATGVPAHVIAQIKGFSKLEFTFDLGLGTGANALYCFLSPS